MGVICSGNCETSPLQWGTQCADIRQLILSKMSFHDLASTAPTCREFHEEFVRCVQNEQARLISSGEQLYGKKEFSGFVKAFRRVMRDVNAYPGMSGKPGVVG